MPHIDELEVHILEDLLQGRGLDHLRVRKHGRKLYIESIVGTDAVKHARLTIKTSSPGCSRS